MSPNVNRSRILVVDDESIVVSLVRDALEDEDYDIITAMTGDEALAIVQSEELDLLVTDIRMPGMTGIELVKLARDRQPDLGVIFMTGYANLNSAKDAIKQGAFDYIMKPFELTEIRQAVRNGLKIKAAAAEKTSTTELTKLSDLNQMLFATSDRASLVTSSLKFILMNLHIAKGSATFHDKENEACATVSIVDGVESRDRHSDAPIQQAVQKGGAKNLQYPLLIDSAENHPLYLADPQPELQTLVRPSWASDTDQMIIVPITRNGELFGWFALGPNEPIIQLRDADLKFLTITAGQLAITLENQALLEETQKAYSGLKELQDETVRLEKIATRGQMSAEIGHELNNFLGVVAGNLQLLDFHLKKGNVQDLGKYVSAMSGTIEKIKVFTANLMDLTPISSEKTVMSFGKLMSEVIDYLRPQKRFQGVQIKVSGTDLHLPFEADSTQMQQLLYNLFNNAADAMVDRPKKEITVELSATNDTQFAVAIRDTGCGFPPELLKRAFQERFTTKKLGHGFGLVVCKRIIENHGGKLVVESMENQGSTISITFPLAETELVPA